MYRGANYKMSPGPYHIRMLIYSFRKRKEKKTRLLLNPILLIATRKDYCIATRR